MTTTKSAILFTLLLTFSFCQTASDLAATQFYSDPRQSIIFKSGTTFQATIWPQQQNSFVGRMSCNGCNPQTGDTPCTETLPITCIIHPATLDRPYYNYYPDFTSYDNPDQSFYEGWTGGIIGVTDPVKGLSIDSYVTGDNYCKTAFGPQAKFATFSDGYYMSNMNGPNLNIQKAWNYTLTSSGEYNFWGYFNHAHIGKSWIWSPNIPTGNCIIPTSNPIS